MSVLAPNVLHELLVRVLEQSGFSSPNAMALADQIVLAEELGQQSVGVAHVFDYIDGLKDGRIDGGASPDLSTPAATIIHVDGNGGLPQLGFDLAYNDIIDTAHRLGLCLFLHRNATCCGSLGTFALRIAEAGLLCIAATNGSPLLAGSGSTKPVFCTNPMAFSAPQIDDAPLLIDQSSSATAYVNIRAAAERGENIPNDWAIDKNGQPTTNPNAALEGTLLPFGGSRGANIALMVEVLSAGLAGANWSLDAPSFFDGSQCPGTGLFLLAINPAPVTQNFLSRMSAQIGRLASDFNVHIPGSSKASLRRSVAIEGIQIDNIHLDRLKSMIGKGG